jgi:hypothetical protein
MLFVKLLEQIFTPSTFGPMFTKDNGYQFISIPGFSGLSKPGFSQDYKL